VIGQSLAIKGVLDRINVIHVQAIAELVDASSDLLIMIRDIDETRHAMRVPCQIGRVPYA
jgi:hypothetical protein